MKAFLKENIILVLGVSLPLLLAIIFLLANQIGKAAIAPPQYDVVFTNGHNYGTNQTHQIVVKDDQAYLSYLPPEKNRHPNYQKLELYVFSPKTGITTEITLPKTRGMERKEEILIEDLSDKKISAKSQSPDGYRFSNNYRRNSNLMTEIFGGGGRNRHSFVLQNGQRQVTIPNSQNYRSKFVGWIIPETDQEK